MVQPDYQWKRIEPLSDADRLIDIAGMQPLYRAWRDSKQRLKQGSSRLLDEFNRKLVRRLSIETGILERLYDLDRGTTEALIQHGFAEDLIAHGSSNLSPASLIDILRDQEAAVSLVMDGVAKSREFTKSFLNELHSILTRHQQSTTAVDQFDNKVEIALIRGKFKEFPNNPRRPDGSLHEYCPPIHVDSEIERMIEIYDSYQHEDPILTASWLHHRFTQIHPYQDGNGRVARAIVTMVLLRHDLLPLVIDRDLRTEYLEALERADSGDLSQLAGIFARMEKGAILQALSVDADAEEYRQESLTSAVIASLTDKFSKRKADRNAQLTVVNNVAFGLREQARITVDQRLTDLCSAVQTIGVPQVKVENGGTDTGTAHWYKNQVIKTARDAEKYANFSQNHYFTKGSMRVNEERLVFVVSFHHIGFELTGFMEATAFAEMQSNQDPEDQAPVEREFRQCSVEPFVFTYRTKASEVRDAFLIWLDASLAVAFKEFGDRL